MTAREWLAGALMLVGGFFLLAGTVGVLRFPDLYTRLHALSKADNLGLGFLVVGLSVESGSWGLALKLVFVWLLVMLTGSMCCQLVAQVTHRSGVEPWSRK